MADDDELGVEQAELTEMLFRRAAQNGTSPESEMQHMMEHNHAGEWMQEIRRTKALRKIVAASTITDEAGNVVDIASVRADGTLAEPEASDEAPGGARRGDEPKAAKAAEAEKADAELVDPRCPATRRIAGHRRFGRQRTCARLLGFASPDG